MKNSKTAEAYVLDRMMYLLEEGSVRYLTQHDDNFGDFVSQLYAKLNDRATYLRSSRVAA
jgi:hypothetical protein